VFFDDRPLWRVMSVAEVGPGKFFFDYASHRIYIGDDPTSHIVEASVLENAVTSEGTNATDVRLQALVIEKFANHTASGVLLPGARWSIVDSEIRLNHGVGLCNVPLVQRCRIHHNGQAGFCAIGISDVTVEDTEIAFNNTAGYDPYAGSASYGAMGGGVFYNASGITLRGNDCHDNAGLGFQTIAGVSNTLFESNHIANNAGMGILIHDSASAIIRNNTVERNGLGPHGGIEGAGILIYTSPDVEVAGNTVRNNGDGIAAEHRMVDSSGVGIRNLYVHDNIITLSDGGAGLITDQTSTAVFTSMNNRFEHNTWNLPTLGGSYFNWLNQTMTKDQWIAAGQDTTGTFQVIH
jgi:parallel beta-helix repeat protein